MTPVSRRAKKPTRNLELFKGRVLVALTRLPVREKLKSSVAETSRFGLSGTESDLHSRFSSSKSKLTLPDLERVLQDLTATARESFILHLHLYIPF